MVSAWPGLQIDVFRVMQEDPLKLHAIIIFDLNQRVTSLCGL